MLKPLPRLRASNHSRRTRLWYSSRVVTVGLHFTYADTSDCIVFFLTSLHRSPCTILSGRRLPVRYDLGVFWHTIRSLVFLVYDIHLRATAATILRIRGVQIPIDLVSSATDSYRRSVVLFKPMSVPTSDPKCNGHYNRTPDLGK